MTKETKSPAQLPPRLQALLVSRPANLPPVLLRAIQKPVIAAQRSITK